MKHIFFLTYEFLAYRWSLITNMKSDFENFKNFKLSDPIEYTEDIKIDLIT